MRHLLKENGVLPVVRFSAYRLSKKDALLPLRVGGANLWLRTMNTDLVTARHCLAEGEFDAAAELVRDRKAPLFIVDAGGYIGTAAIALAQLFPNATIVTLEPSNENYRILAQNVEPYENIVPIHAALDAEDGEKAAVRSRDRGLGLFHGCGRRGAGLPEVGMTRTVSIPSLLAEMKRERVDILKLDIEGAERDVLGLGVMDRQGGHALRRASRPHRPGLHGRLYEGVGGDEAIPEEGGQEYGGARGRLRPSRA